MTWEENLLEYRRQLQDPHTAYQVWTKHLTDKERKRLGGDLEAAYRDRGRTIGIWATAKSVDENLATLQLARLYGMPDSEYFPLLRQVSPAAPRPGQPEWNAESGQLRLGGVLIRQVASPSNAHNIVAVLNAFEAESWPPRISVPPELSSDVEAIGKTVSSLNRNLQAIRFRRDGTGTGICWESTLPVPQ